MKRRHEAGGEQAADRDLADRAVQDEADPRRNDRRQQRAERQHARRRSPSRSRASASRGPACGSASRRRRCTSPRRRPSASTSAIDTCASPPFMPAGEHGASSSSCSVMPRLVHEVAGQDEERHRQQREVLRLGDGELDRDGGRQLRVLQEEQRTRRCRWRTPPACPSAAARQTRQHAETISMTVGLARRCPSPSQLVAHLEERGDEQQQRPDRHAHRDPGVADLGDALEAARAAGPRRARCPSPIDVEQERA